MHPGRIYRGLRRKEMRLSCIKENLDAPESHYTEQLDAPRRKEMRLSRITKHLDAPGCISRRLRHITQHFDTLFHLSSVATTPCFPFLPSPLLAPLLHDLDQAIDIVLIFPRKS